jgi:hypothetical protein
MESTMLLIFSASHPCLFLPQPTANILHDISHTSRTEKPVLCGCDIDQGALNAVMVVKRVLMR